MSSSHSPADSPPQQLRRRRSVDMYDRMEDRDWMQDVVTRGGEHYLIIDDQEYRILDSGMTEFDNSNKPLVSVGAYLSRELIILNPSNHFLRDVYAELREEIRNLDDENQNIQNILDHTILFVRSYLKPVPGTSKAKVEEFLSDPKNYMESSEHEPLEYRHNPVVALDAFVEEGVGVCRHHALFLAFLINNLVLDRLLPPGNVFSHRDTVKSGGAHVWTIYKPIQHYSEDGEYDFYLADSLWHKEAYNLRLWAPFWKDYGYGETAIQYCMDRHSKPDIETLSYTKLNAENKERYIHDLLTATTEDRRKFLNHQYRLGGLESIVTALKSVHNYRRYENYKALLDDIDRIFDKTLHKKPYGSFKEPDDRQQFVLGLLCQSETQRDAVLDKQTTDDLIKLKAGLETLGRDRKGLYQQFDTYQTLLNEVKNRLDIKFLHEMHYTEIETTAQSERFIMALLTADAMERAAVLDRQNLADLQLMKVALDTKYKFYAHFDVAYKAMLIDVEQRIKLKEFQDQHYHQIGSGATRQLFVTELLKCSLDDVRTVLDKQDIRDLRHLLKSLTSKDIYAKQNPQRHHALVTDIQERIELKTFLRDNHYRYLDNQNAKRRFVRGLLSENAEERNLILERQTINDLNRLQATLRNSSDYKEYASYQSVMNEIDRRMISRSLKLVKQIITSGKLEMRSGWSTNIWAPGKKIIISPDTNMRVPASAQAIFDQINQVNLDLANVSRLRVLLNTVTGIATTASQKDHDDRSKSTKSLLNILKDDNSNIELVERLEELYDELTTPVAEGSLDNSLSS